MNKHEKALSLLSKLAARYPHLFCDPPVPLKIGIRDDLLADPAFRRRTKADMRRAIKLWTVRPDYQLCLIVGTPRVGTHPDVCPGQPVSREAEKAAMDNWQYLLGHPPPWLISMQNGRVSFRGQA